MKYNDRLQCDIISGLKYRPIEISVPIQGIAVPLGIKRHGCRTYTYLLVLSVCFCSGRFFASVEIHSAQMPQIRF